MSKIRDRVKEKIKEIYPLDDAYIEGILSIPEIKQALEGCDKCTWKSIGRQFR